MISDFVVRVLYSVLYSGLEARMVVAPGLDKKHWSHSTSEPFSWGLVSRQLWPQCLDSDITAVSLVCVCIACKSPSRCQISLCLLVFFVSFLEHSLVCICTLLATPSTHLIKPADYRAAFFVRPSSRYILEGLCHWLDFFELVSTDLV